MKQLGPVAPTDQASGKHRPGGDVTITSGLWGDWQRRNHESSLPHAVRQLAEAGNMHNLQLAAGVVQGEFRGRVFMDSDVYKVLEAIAWDLARQPDDEFRRVVEEWIELLDQAQDDDGYLNSWIQVNNPEQRYTALASSHEMYCLGHLFQAAVAAHRSIADDRLSGVARRAADHLAKEFMYGERREVDGHPGVETALVELHRLTGDESYLDLAKTLVERRGYGLAGDSPRGSVYLQDHESVREKRTLIGHAVRALYLEAGVVDVAMETGDAQLLEASARRWDDMVTGKTSITGGVGSRHMRESFGDQFELPPDRAYNETCAAVASVHWSWRLLLATGAAKYAELMERTLFNTLAASTAVDGTRFFYVNPLQRRGDYVEVERFGRRKPWFDCACCPPNVARLVASLHHYLATVTADTLYVHQFAPSTIRVDTPSGTAELVVDTDYPWDGTVRAIVNAAPQDEWTLALRVPTWSRHTELAVNAETWASEPDANGYATITRRWRPGDTVTFTMDLTPRLTYPHYRIDALRGSVALERGPLVYCFEQIDQDDGVDIDELVLTANADLRVVQNDDAPVLGRTAVIETDAVAISPERPSGLPYQPWPADLPITTESTSVRAIPYFQWDNREDGAMRVWMPLARGGKTA